MTRPSPWQGLVFGAASVVGRERAKAAHAAMAHTDRRGSSTSSDEEGICRAILCLGARAFRRSREFKTSSYFDRNCCSFRKLRIEPANAILSDDEIPRM